MLNAVFVYALFARSPQLPQWKECLLWMVEMWADSSLYGEPKAKTGSHAVGGGVAGRRGQLGLVVLTAARAHRPVPVRDHTLPPSSYDGLSVTLGRPSSNDEPPGPPGGGGPPTPCSTNFSPQAP